MGKQSLWGLYSELPHTGHIAKIWGLEKRGGASGAQSLVRKAEFREGEGSIFRASKVCLSCPDAGDFSEKRRAGVGYQTGQKGLQTALHLKEKEGGGVLGP